MLGAAHLEALAVGVAVPGGLDLLGHVRAQLGAEALPLAGQHAVALEVAEGAVVGDDLEAVAQRLPAAAGLVAPVGARAGELGDQLRALGARRGARRPRAAPPRPRRSPRTGTRRSGRPRCPRRAAAAPTAAPRPRARRRARTARPPARRARAAARRYSIQAPPRSGMSTRFTKAGITLRSSRQRPLAELARLGQRRGQQPQQQLLVGLARRVHADVAERGRGQQARASRRAPWP